MSIHHSFGEEGEIVMKCRSLSVAIELEKMGLSLDWWFPNVDGVTRECFKEHVERDYSDSASRLLELWDAGLWDKAECNGVCGREFDTIGIPLLLAYTLSEWCQYARDAYELVNTVRHALDVVSVMFPKLPAPWVLADCFKGYVHLDCGTFREIVGMRVSESVMIPLLVCSAWSVLSRLEPMGCVAMVRSQLKLMADCFSNADEDKYEERNEENE